MTIIDLLNKAIQEQDFIYVEQALSTLIGTNVSEKPVKKKTVKKTKVESNKSSGSDFVNKFVDDLSIHPELISKTPKKIKKQHRPEFVPNTVDASCSKCGAKEIVDKDEINSLSRLAEGQYAFTCAKCLKRNISR